MSEQNLVDAAQMVFADEFDEPIAANGAGEGDETGPGMGQSKSSRRRRRKRKNKMATQGAPAEGGTTEGASPAAATIVMEGESLALAGSPGFGSSTPAPAPASTRRQPRESNGGGQNNGSSNSNGSANGAGNGANAGGATQGKRWKKKFRDRERGGRRAENPGNDFRGESNSHSNNGGGGYGGHRPDNFGNLAGGFKRKTKGGGKDRGFVGPMDHSYRAEDPNFGNAPPSTINLQGSARRHGHRHHGDSQPIDHNAPRPVPIPENAQTHIYFFIEELFFIAKIQETAKKQGVKIAFVKNDKDALAELTSGEEANHPALIVFDLNNANAKPLTTIPKLKAKLKRGTSIVGFLSHLQGDLKAKAMEAGCDVVMPRAAFSQGLPNLLRRYGLVEEDEINYNY